MYMNAYVALTLLKLTDRPIRIGAWVQAIADNTKFSTDTINRMREGGRVGSSNNNSTIVTYVENKLKDLQLAAANIRSAPVWPKAIEDVHGRVNRLWSADGLTQEDRASLALLMVPTINVLMEQAEEDRNLEGMTRAWWTLGHLYYIAAKIKPEYFSISSDAYSKAIECLDLWESQSNRLATNEKLRLTFSILACLPPEYTHQERADSVHKLEADHNFMPQILAGAKQQPFDALFFRNSLSFVGLLYSAQRSSQSDVTSLLETGKFLLDGLSRIDPRFCECDFKVPAWPSTRPLMGSKRDTDCADLVDALLLTNQGIMNHE